jgi:hypothetical protein
VDFGGSGLIRGVAVGWEWPYKRVDFGGSGLIYRMAFGGSGLIYRMVGYSHPRPSCISGHSHQNPPSYHATLIRPFPPKASHARFFGWLNIAEILLAGC